MVNRSLKLTGLHQYVPSLESEINQSIQIYDCTKMAANDHPLLPQSYHEIGNVLIGQVDAFTLNIHHRKKGIKNNACAKTLLLK